MKRLVFFAAAVFAFAVSADELMFSCDLSSDLRMWETNAYRGSFKVPKEKRQHTMHSAERMHKEQGWKQKVLCLIKMDELI